MDGAPVPFTFNSTYMIRISPAPVGSVAIYRETPSDEPVNVFTDGSILVADELNAAFLQSLFVAQEVSDKLPGRDSTGSWDFDNRRLANVAEPEFDNDAASVGWVKGQYNSGVDAHVARLASEAARDASQVAQAAAETEADAAETSATNAATSASQASTQRSQAEVARTEAEAARDAAITARGTAQGYRDTALEHRNAAAGSASTATTKAAEASASAAAAALFDPATYYNKAQVDAKAVPIGASIAWNSLTPPPGYLKENGAAISRSAYPELFAAIGTTHGAGNGTTTFNVPDSRGVVVRGLDDGRGLDPGRVLGSYQADENKSHTHTGTALSAGAHTHTYSQGPDASGSGGAANGDPAGSYTTSSAGAHTHVLSIDADGGSEARMKNTAKLYVIRAF